MFIREESQKRVKELQIAVDETDQRLAETQEVALRVKGLEEQLELKTVELKEEMDDRDKAEDRVLRMTENLACKEKELETMRQEVINFKMIYYYFLNVKTLKIIDNGIEEIYYGCISPVDGLLYG